MATIIFITHDAERHQVDAPLGLSIMEITKAHPFALEAACGGAMSCATCHVLVADHWLDRLLPPSEAEEGVLDVAFGITPASRLGCQIEMTAELDGLEIHLPEPLSAPLGA